MNIRIPKFLQSRVFNFFNVVLAGIAFIQYCLTIPIAEGNNSLLILKVDLYLDYKIKFIPGFLIFYLSVYILIIYSVYFVTKKHDTYELSVFLLSLVLLWSFLNLAHTFIFTKNVMRPQISSTGFFYDAINFLYSKVKPFNNLPSWHVSTAVLCAIALIKANVSKKILIYIWVGLICISPLFIKMNYIVEAAFAIPFPFFCYSIAERAMRYATSKEVFQEIKKTFTLESLIQSVAIGIRDDSTLLSLTEGLERIEKNLTEKDKEEIKQICTEFDLPVVTLKEIINNIIVSINAQEHLKKAREMFGKDQRGYSPTDHDLRQATEELINSACRPFDSPKFRYILLEIRKRNAHMINITSIEEAAKEKSQSIITKFTGFIESHKKDIPALKTILNSSNGNVNLSGEDVKLISKELRKPPYEMTIDEVWNAFLRMDSVNVKPIGDSKNPLNIVLLAQYAMGKIDTLEPFSERVDLRFNEWIKENEHHGRKFTNEEMDWLLMMKNYVLTSKEINMMSFNHPPFINKGGASKAYNLFGQDLNRILYELNEKLHQ